MFSAKRNKLDPAVVEQKFSHIIQRYGGKFCPKAQCYLLGNMEFRLVESSCPYAIEYNSTTQFGRFCCPRFKDLFRLLKRKLRECQENTV